MWRRPSRRREILHHLRQTRKRPADSGNANNRDGSTTAARGYCDASTGACTHTARG